MTCPYTECAGCMGIQAEPDDATTFMTIDDFEREMDRQRKDAENDDDDEDGLGKQEEEDQPRR
jgi:hypothetical protein